MRQENRQNRRYKSLQDKKHNIYMLKNNQRRGHSSKKNERGHSLGRKRDKYRKGTISFYADHNSYISLGCVFIHVYSSNDWINIFIEI